MGISVYNEKPTEDGLFAPTLWRIVLSCFPEMEAVHLDMTYGGFQTPWMIRHRITASPGSHTWILATKSESIGMMGYLLKYQVPCQHIDQLIQYAVDHNHLRTACFFLNENNLFMDGNGDKIQKREIPHVDHACKKNFTAMVQMLITVTPSFRYGKLLKEPVSTLTIVMSLGFIDMMKLMIPTLTSVTNYQGLKLAAKNDHIKTFQFATQHLHPSYMPHIPEQVIQTICSYGRMSMLMTCMEKLATPYVSQACFNAAFLHGQRHIIKYIESIHQDYVPPRGVILEACKNGRNNVIAALSSKVRLPVECLAEAAKGQSSKLIRTLHRRLPDVPFNNTMITDAIQSGRTSVVSAIYECGRFTSLTDTHKILLVTKHMNNALSMFHALGLVVYTEEALLEACRVCCLPIIRDILCKKTGNLVPSVKGVDECLHRLFVSDPKHRDDKVEAFTLVRSLNMLTDETYNLNKRQKTAEISQTLKTSTIRFI